MLNLAETASLRRWLIVGLAIGLACWPLLAQAPANGNSDEPVFAPPESLASNINPADLSMPAVPADYRVGPNDLLSIYVLRMPDLTRQVRVGADGTIQLPLLSRPLGATGLTAQDIAREITAQLVRHQLAVTPTVQVIVRQVLSRPIVVSGMVAKPMVLQAERPMRLLEVLARAGGLGEGAGTTVLLTQPGPQGARTHTLDLEKLTQTTDEADNPLLYGDDVVRVLPARKVYVVGAFQKPGAFPVQAGQPITVLEAIALAQGFSEGDPADKSHAKIIRTSSSGVPVAIPINITDMLKHEVPDRTLEAGDVLYVPVNGTHKALLSALQYAAQAAVVGVGYNAARIF